MRQYKSLLNVMSTMVFGVFGCLLLVSNCLAVSPVDQHSRIDEVVMYGGIERSNTPELKEADEKFIADVTVAFGSRERASIAWVNQGYKFYRQDQLGMATRRFNQAWLLNANNPEVYTGFGSVLHDQGKNCDAMKIMEKALMLAPPSFQGIYTDAARIITLCAVGDKALSFEAKTDLFARSELLYKKGEALEPDKSYLYDSWARAYYDRGQYVEAWSMIFKVRAAGGKPSENFIRLLQLHMSSPTEN